MFIVDAHVDTLWAAPREGRDWTARSERGHADLERMIEGGAKLVVFALFTSPFHRGRGYTADALAMIERYYDGLERASDRYRLGTVLCQSDLDYSGEHFKGLLSIEGGEVLQGSIEALHAFFRLGVRAMGLVWNHRNELADGIADAESNGGLTPFGRRVVETMERLGMAVDVSHLSPAGFWDVARRAEKPFYASHSNARAVADHPRNLDDDQLKALSECDGVVGINFNPAFLTGRGEATVEDVVRHIEYIAGKFGIERVGIGTDYDGISSTPVGLEETSKIGCLADALRSRGFLEHEVEAVMGGNLLRFFRRVLPAT